MAIPIIPTRTSVSRGSFVGHGVFPRVPSRNPPCLLLDPRPEWHRILALPDDDEAPLLVNLEAEGAADVEDVDVSEFQTTTNE